MNTPTRKPVADLSRIEIYRFVFFDIIEKAAPAEQELLIRRYAFSETYVSIGRRLGITKQGAFKRVEAARKRAGVYRDTLNYLGDCWQQMRIKGFFDFRYTYSLQPRINQSAIIYKRH